MSFAFSARFSVSVGFRCLWSKSTATPDKINHSTAAVPIVEQGTREISARKAPYMRSEEKALPGGLPAGFDAYNRLPPRSGDILRKRPAKCKRLHLESDR